MITWATGLASKVWLWLAGAAAAAAVLAAAYASIRRGGRDAERADVAVDVAKRTRIATQARIEAMKPVTTQEEAHDPFNRDRL